MSRVGEILTDKAETLYGNGFTSKYLCSLKNRSIDLSMPETLENSLIESEMMSLSVKISRLLCIGVPQSLLAYSDLSRKLEGLVILSVPLLFLPFLYFKPFSPMAFFFSSVSEEI